MGFHVVDSGLQMPRDNEGFTRRTTYLFKKGNAVSPNASPDKIKVERIADAHTDIAPSASSSATAIMIDDSD